MRSYLQKAPVQTHGGSGSQLGPRATRSVRPLDMTRSPTCIRPSPRLVRRAHDTCRDSQENRYIVKRIPSRSPNRATSIAPRLFFEAPVSGLHSEQPVHEALAGSSCSYQPLAAFAFALCECANLSVEPQNIAADIRRAPRRIAKTRTNAVIQANKIENFELNSAPAWLPRPVVLRVSCGVRHDRDADIRRFRRGCAPGLWRPSSWRPS